MSFPAYADAKWIRQRYSYEEEHETRIRGVDNVFTFPEYRRYIEQITATRECQGVDSQTVKTDITDALPSISIPGGGTDSLGGSGGSGGDPWTTQSPEIEDIPGGNSRVTVTWKRTTAWVQTDAGSDSA